MKLKKLDSKNNFTIIIKGDFKFSDYGYSENTFSIEDFDYIIALLTITQDIYNKLNEMEEYTEDYDISTNLTPFINAYFDKITDLNDYYGELIDDEISGLLPKQNDSEYFYPRHIEYIKIIKNGKIYLLEKQQTDKDIKKAQKYLSEYFDEE